MAKVKATPERVLAVAQAEVGYLEKKTNSQLDDKTANAGYGNYTKYARDLDAIPGFYNGRKNGFDWCDVFVDWLFVKAFGVEAAKKLLCQPDKSLGAGCRYSANYYEEKGQFHTKNPKPGDQIFYWNSGKTDVAHTGIVYKVDSQYVYTVEGNTSTQAGVVANGGGVAQKSYPLSYYRIYGYGRPDYANVLYEDNGEVTPEVKPEPEKTNKGEFTMEMRTLKYGSKGEDVKALQILLLGNGCSIGKWGADGDFGIATQNAVKEYQRKKKLTDDGIAGPNTWGKLLGVK
jgi:peptidoglycan hydrolase-like protein with peptidoglycan-binding domain